MKHENDDIKGKSVVVSGFGNVAWGICKKLAELGAKAVTLSGPDGYIYDPEGVVTEEKINYMLEMRASGRNKVQDYADKFGVQFFPGEKPFGVKADIVMRLLLRTTFVWKRLRRWLLTALSTTSRLLTCQLPTKLLSS